MCALLGRFVGIDHNEFLLTNTKFIDLDFALQWTQTDIYFSCIAIVADTAQNNNLT